MRRLRTLPNLKPLNVAGGRQGMLTIGRALFDGSKNKLGLEAVQVVPEALRCMQCGICSYNCPAGIDVRAYAWQGQPVDDTACLTCGQCILRCPRRVLHFEPIKQSGRIKE